MFNRNIHNYLLEWKNRGNRKPLVIRGARQVGKTSAVAPTIKRVLTQDVAWVRTLFPRV